MTTFNELISNLHTDGYDVDLDSNGVIYPKAGYTPTQNDIDEINTRFTTWGAQTDAQKQQSEDFVDAKAHVLAIRGALNSISDPSAITLNNDYVVYDTDDTTPLLTVPSDSNWASLNNAQVKAFVREFTLTYARVLEYAIAQKDGYLTIKKYINSELKNGS